VEAPSLYNPDVSPELEEIVLKALKKNQDDRMQTAEVFSQSLNAFVHKNFPHFSKKNYRNFIQEYFSKEIKENVEIRKDVELKGSDVLSLVHSKISQADRSSGG